MFVLETVILKEVEVTLKPTAAGNRRSPFHDGMVRLPE